MWTGGACRTSIRWHRTSRAAGGLRKAVRGAQPTTGRLGGWLDLAKAGTVNERGNFCGNCGSPRPQRGLDLRYAGTVNRNFCGNCKEETVATNAAHSAVGKYARIHKDCDRGDRRGAKRKKTRGIEKGTAAWRREQTYLERQNCGSERKEKDRKNGII